MDPERAKQIREAMKLKPSEMARKLHVIEDTIRKWERGSSTIKGPAYLLYRMMEKKLIKKGLLKKCLAPARIAK